MTILRVPSGQRGGWLAMRPRRRYSSVIDDARESAEFAARQRSGGLERVWERLEAAVAARIASLPETDASVGVEAAWDAVQDVDLSGFAQRVADAAARLGLDELSLEALWLCAAPELDDRCARVFAFLHGDSQSWLATPRLIASLL